MKTLVLGALETKISISSLLIASCLVFISIFFSYYQKLKLEKETIIGILRAIIQLTIVGYVLNFIFGLKNPLFTTLLVFFILLNAAFNASKGEKVLAMALLFLLLP